METLYLAATLSLVAAALYGFVGLRLAQRPVSREARLAQAMFALWWFALAAYNIGQAVMTLLFVAESLQVTHYQAFVQAMLVAIMAGLAGLVYYLLYLYTGRRNLWVPVTVYYAILYVLLVVLLSGYGAPERVVSNGWQISTEPRPETDVWFGLAFLVLFVGPQIAAAVAYALLYRRATDNTQRYRIALVAGTILVWFGSTFLTTLAQASRSPGVQAVSILLGLAAGTTILLAYMPPRAWKARWGLRSIRDESPATGS